MPRTTIIYIILRYIFFVLPHTLKVNELPSHSHRIPGYWYGDLGSSASSLDNEPSGQIRSASRRVNGDWYNRTILDPVENIESFRKIYREFTLGVVDDSASLTQNSGNNESIVLNYIKNNNFIQ